MNELKDAIVQHRKLLLWIFLAVAAVCWFLGSSFVNLIHNKLEQKRLARVNVQLDEEYEQLQQKLELLQKQDPAYVEGLARVKYNMSAPGETEYRFKVK